MVRIPTLKKSNLLVPPGLKIGGQQIQFPNNRQDQIRKPDKIVLSTDSVKPSVTPELDMPPLEKRARMSPSLRPADEIKIEYFEN